MEIKQNIMQTSRLSELAVLKGEGSNNRKEKFAEKGLIVAFGDLMFAQLETMSVADGKKMEAINEQSVSVPDIRCLQESFPGSHNFMDLVLSPPIELQKPLDLSPLQKVDTHPYQGDVPEDERLPHFSNERKVGVVEEDIVIDKNGENRLTIEKQHIRNPVSQMEGQEEDPTNNGVNLRKVVDHVNVVNQVIDKALDFSLLKEVDNVEAKKLNINKGIFQETSQVAKEKTVLEGAETKVNHLEEEVRLNYQRVAVHEAEDLPAKKEIGNTVSRMNGQEESPTNNGSNLGRVVNQFNVVNQVNAVNAVNAVNRITDEAIASSPLKEVDNVEVKKSNINKGIFQEASQVAKEKTVLEGAETKVNHRAEEVSLNYQRVAVHEAKDLSAKKEIGNPVSLMKGQEESPINNGANLGRIVTQVNVVNQVNRVNQITDKAIASSPLKEVDNVEAKKLNMNKGIFQETSQVAKEKTVLEGSETKVDHRIEKVILPYQRVVHEKGRVLANNEIGTLAIEEAIVMNKNGENRLTIEKQQIRNSVSQMKGQGKDRTNNGANLRRVVNQVNAVNRITDEAIDSSILKEVDNVEAKKLNINKGIFQETAQVAKEKTVMEGAETKVDHRIEKVILPYQRVVHEEERVPARKKIGILAIEEDIVINKNGENRLTIEKQQIRNPVSQMKGQEEDPTNNGANLRKVVNQVNVVNLVNRIIDKGIDLSPIKEVDNVEAKKFNINKGMYQEISQVIKEKTVHEEKNLPEKQELKMGAVKEDVVISKNIENHEPIEKQMTSNPAVQMRGREEKPTDMKMGLDKLPFQVGEMFQQVSIEKKHQSWQLQLEPENLGKLKIIVNYDRGKISAEFLVETGQTAKALENYLDTLKQNLSQKNIDVSAFSVSVAGQSLGGGSQGLPQPFSRRERGVVPRGDEYSLPIQEEGEKILEGISVNYLV